MRGARVLAVGLIVVLGPGCGRVLYVSLDGGIDASVEPDAASPLPLDAAVDAPGSLADAPLDLTDALLGLDAPLELVDAASPAEDVEFAPADAFVPVDAFDPADAFVSVAPFVSVDAFVRADAFVPPDAGGRRVLVVTTTAPSGPGSLEEALLTVNRSCALGPYTVAFDISDTDPGYVGDMSGTNRWWRMRPTTTRNVTCPDTIIDGTTQTLNRGDTNPFVLTGVPAGAAGVPLPPIAGPEIELRGFPLIGPMGAGLRLRGLAMQAFLASVSSLVVEQCFFGSEPNRLVALPPTERYAPRGSAFHVECLPGCLGRQAVFMAANGPTGGTYNFFSFRTGSVGATLRDSYFGGSVTGAGSWDLLYLVTAEDHRILHNYLGAAGFEFHIEWVPGYGGEIRENTFVGARTMSMAISMGGAATMSGNDFVP